MIKRGEFIGETIARFGHMGIQFEEFSITVWHVLTKMLAAGMQQLTDYELHIGVKKRANNR